MGWQDIEVCPGHLCCDPFGQPCNGLAWESPHFPDATWCVRTGRVMRRQSMSNKRLSKADQFLCGQTPGTRPSA